MICSDPICVCTLDSQPLIHAGVRHLLSPFTDIAVVGEAYDARELLQFAQRHVCAVALVEIDDCGERWADVLQAIQRDALGLRLVVFTHSAEQTVVREALAQGVAGYLLKRSSPLTLASTIRSTAAGHQVLAPEAIEALTAPTSEPVLHQLLSWHERKVLTLLSQGYSNKQIAERLHVSVATVKYHMSAINRKLGVTNRVQALARAYEANLVPRLVLEAEQPRHRRTNLVEPSMVRRA